MAYLIAAVIVFFMGLAGCGKKDDGGSAAAPACSSAYNGIYKESGGDKVALASDCAYKYEAADRTCTSLGTYSNPAGASGTMLVTIKSTSGENCQPAGEYRCAYKFEGSAFTYDCGAGVKVGTKQ